MAVSPRTQRVYQELVRLQAVLDKAEPGSLSFDFRNLLLETVEKLPKKEKKHWKRTYGEALRQAVGTPEPPVLVTIPVTMPTDLADLIAATALERSCDPDTVICEALERWRRRN